MKSSYFMPAWALICAAGLFSCSLEIENPDESKEYEYFISAYAEGSATRAELSSGNTILWQEGDEISVLSNTTSNDRFVLTGGHQTDEGVFGGSLSNEDMPHVGVYPYNAGHMYGEIGSLVWGKSIQIATEGDFDPNACLMAGRLDSYGKINFKNICSYIKVETDFACTSIEITSTGNPLVSDIVTFTFDEEGVPASIGAVEGLGNTYQTVKLVGEYDEKGNSKLIPAGTYYVAVLPQTYSSLTFTFNTEFGRKIDKPTAEGVSIGIKRNTIVKVGAFLLDKLLDGGSADFYGSGTKENPYLISSLEKLKLLASRFSDHENYPSYYTKDTYFLQTKDIDCGGEEISIGSIKTDADQTIGTSNYYYPFTGIYDGGGYKITNYKLKECKGSIGFVAGLFNNIYQGTIKNLTVAPASAEIIKSTNSDKLYVGALIGAAGHHPTENSTGMNAYVTVSNCHLIGGPYNLKASRSKFFGGLVGQSCGDYLRLENCSNEASLSSADGDSGSDGYENVVGGLIGEVTFSYNGGEGGSGSHRPLLEIAKCRNKGNVSASSNYLPCFAGGLVGLWCDYNSKEWHNLEAHVSNSVNEGNVTTSSQRTREVYVDVSETCGPSCAGGFFGFFGEDTSTSYFHNCLNKGNIEAKAPNGYSARAGGFLGYSKENNNTSQDTGQDGSGDHVYAAMCVNTGSIIGHKDNAGTFCGTINGMKCVNCIWLDEHDYSDGIRAALPYRPGLDDKDGGNYDTEHDVYFFNTINAATIAAAFKKMTDSKDKGGRACKYDGDKFKLRWGTDDWQEYAVAWKDEAKWNQTNALDLDFNSKITE